MPGIRRPRGATHAEQQEKLVTAVHRGVDRLTEHRGAASEAGGEEFRYGDKKITAEGGIDDALGCRSGHSCLYTTSHHEYPCTENLTC
jgi:hypothetical protein